MGILVPLLLGFDEIGGGAGDFAPPDTATVAQVVITPSQVEVTAGQFTELTARYYDSDGNELTGRQIVWSSSNPDVASISPAGVLIGIAAGTVMITATVEGVSSTVPGTVAAAPVTPGPIPQQPSIYDPPALVEACRRLAGRPDIDAGTTDDDWYAYLTEAEQHYVQQIAVHCPEVLYGPPELMTTPDGGYTYRTAHYPLGRMEVRESPSGRLLSPTTGWGHGDFVPEGQTIRIPNGQRRTFFNGPWARYVRAPWRIHKGQGSQLPDMARRLLVYHAVTLWATRGGYRDPGPFEVLERKAWSGDPNVPGDTGILGALKTQYYGSGAIGVGDAVWYRSPDLG